MHLLYLEHATGVCMYTVLSAELLTCKPSQSTPVMQQRSSPTDGQPHVDTSLSLLDLRAVHHSAR